MTSATPASSVVASRYVRALIELAEESKKIDAVEKDFQDLGSMLEASEDFKHLVSSPLIPAEKQTAAIDAIASQAKLQELTTNFLKVLVQNRRLAILGSVIRAFSSELSKRRGEISVRVQTAQDLSASQIKALEDVLKKQTGTQVSIEAEVKPEIIGGMVVTVGSHMIDDSVRRKLERLKVAMGANTNENTNSTLSEVS